MITDHLRRVVERLSKAPAPVQERYAALIEEGLAQEADQAAQPLAPETFPGYPLGANPLEKYYGRLVDRFSHLSDDEVLATEAAGEIPDDDSQ